MPDYRLEIVDNLSSERIIAATQPQKEGWNSFRFAGLKWNSDSEFNCFWNVDAYGTMSQFFRVKAKPLSMTKTEITP